jgi:molecular chaperone GrpE
MANEPVETVAAQPPQRPTDVDDISGIAEMIEEGAPLEPADVADEADEADAAAPTEGISAIALANQLAERTADLQRLQAEYVNYKRRVERDRELVRQNATYQALGPIIEVLDNIDRAREHGPLDEGFRGVAEQLERVVAQLGLTRFGAPGDAFDPTIHEALSHIGEDPEVEVTTCKVIAKAGYRIGDRVVRVAQVLVVDPAGQGGD